jgi:hypothetical protein
LAGILTLFIILFSLQVNISSCTKEVVTDTLYVRDTVRIFDSTSCNCYDLSDGLVAYYNFNNGSLKDSSGNNNHITFSNAVKTTDRYGRANNAYLFNGSSSYMQVANSTSLNPSTGITLMATFKPAGFYNGSCSVNQVFGKGWNDYIDGHYTLRFVSAAGCGAPTDTSREYPYGAYGNLNGRPSAAAETFYLHTNQWYNLVYTFNDGVASLYINGVLKSSVSANLLFTANSQDLFIGKHGDPQYPYWFNGTIDEVRIYNKGLCAAAVKQLAELKQ